MVCAIVDNALKSNQMASSYLQSHSSGCILVLRHLLADHTVGVHIISTPTENFEIRKTSENGHSSQFLLYQPL